MLLPTVVLTVTLWLFARLPKNAVYRIPADKALQWCRHATSRDAVLQSRPAAFVHVFAEVWH